MNADTGTKRYYRVDLDFWHKTTCQRLLTDLGPWGPCVWLSLIAEAKRSSVPGTLIVTSMEALQDRLGFIEHELPFTLDEFLALTGRLKQTARHRVGHRLHVTLTHYTTWQKDWKRDDDRDRQNRWRSSQNGRDSTSDATHDTDRDRELVLDLDREDLDLGSKQEPHSAAVIRKAENLIRNGGYQLTDNSLLDELQAHRVSDGDAQRLLAYAEQLRRDNLGSHSQAETTVATAHASDPKPAQEPEFDP